MNERTKFIVAKCLNILGERVNNEIVLAYRRTVHSYCTCMASSRIFSSAPRYPTLRERFSVPESREDFFLNSKCLFKAEDHSPSRLLDPITTSPIQYYVPCRCMVCQTKR